MSRRLLCGGLVAALLLIPGTAQAQPASIRVENGRLQPVFTAPWIEESVWVQAPYDSDGDGRRDRIALKITRPRETAQGAKVAAIVEASPYYSGLFDPKDRPWWFDPTIPHPDPREPVASRSPTSYSGYFIPRGFAYVQLESVGTGRSEGCPDAGGPYERDGVKAGIDWLNGRAQGYDAQGNPVPSPRWSTGDVGMIGTSYNGELQNYVATTGVEGLKAIVPTAAPVSKYDYYRSSGALIWFDFLFDEDLDKIATGVLTRRAPWVCKPAMDELTKIQDRETGDWNAAWAARDYVPRAGGVDAAVFVVHGLNDWNVKTRHFARWWDALKRRGVPRKMWLHQSGHTGVPDRSGLRLDTLNRWFGHWVYGVDNDVMDEPPVDVLREDRVTWRQYEDWPAPEARAVDLYLDEGGLSTRKPRGRSGWQAFTDPNLRAEAVAAQPSQPSAGRLAYLSPPLRRDVRISGTPWMDIRARVYRTDANLTAYLVDYTAAGEVSGSQGIVTRGWMDARHHQRLDRAIPLQPGRAYRFRWYFQPDDYVFPAGHRIGVILTGNDGREHIKPDGPEGESATVSVKLKRSRIELPVVGGERALGF